MVLHVSRDFLEGGDRDPRLDGAQGGEGLVPDGSKDQVVPGPQNLEEIPQEEFDKVVAGGAAAEPTAREGRVPAWMREDPPDPSKTSDTIKWKLMHGTLEDDLVADGFNPNSVRICAQELEKEGFRQRPRKPKDKELSVSRSQVAPIRTFAAGSPPEAIINSMHLPIDSNEGKLFEQGMKTGASLVVLAVRIVQEMSTIGVQQTKPLIEMARSMREGEALAAKSAASEAAGEAVAGVAQMFGPTLDRLSKPPEGGDPMKAMMARVMEPMMTRLLSTFMPQLGKGAPASGWEITEE